MDRTIILPGGRMHVSITGNGYPIVLLPGFGNAAPALLTRPFAEALCERYQVVTCEPFGYGESDPAATPRTVENISEELHQAMDRLGIGRYAAAAHSISGLYALYHMHRRPGEITAFIALDISTPQQFHNEFVRAGLAAAEKSLEEQLHASSGESTEEIKRSAVRFLRDVAGYPYTGEEIRQYERMAVRYAHDPTTLDELRHMEDNGKKTEDLSIPDDLPALMLIARENTRRLPEWESWHRALCGAKTETHIIESDHYVHLQQIGQVARLIERLLG